MQAHPDRVIGFGWVDANLGYEAMLDEIKRCHEQYGMVGLKLNGAQNSFIIDDEQIALPLVDAIADRALVLAFHIGTDAYDATHPYRMGRIAKRHPDRQMLMIHMGGVGFHDLSNAAIEVMLDNPTITGIGSAIRPVNVLKALKRLGAERVCFGSDTPFNLMHVEVAAYHTLMDGELSADEQALVMSGNIARVLQL
jgi:predicted TIM-barrel fold metal-dependent hydrolase